MENNIEKTRVKLILPNEEQNCFFVHIVSENWDYSFVPLILHFGEQVIFMNCAGVADVGGRPVLKLVPMDENVTVSELWPVIKKSKDIYIYRR